jgi:hypothetical protein
MGNENEPYELDEDLWEDFKAGTPQNEPTCCSEKELASYIDGKLSFRKKYTLENHLFACSSCLDSLIEIKSLLKASPMTTPEGLINKVKDLVNIYDYEYVLKPTIPAWKLFFLPKEALSWACATLLLFVACFGGMQLGVSFSLLSKDFMSPSIGKTTISQDASIFDVFTKDTFDLLL